LVALKELWEEADSICSKRLAPYLAEFISVLEKYGEIKLTKQVKEKLFAISATTIDRLIHKTYLLNMNGNSYRLKETREWLAEKKEEKDDLN